MKAATAMGWLTRVVLPGLLWTWFPVASPAQETFARHELRKNAKGKPEYIMKVESVFSLLPLHGFAPVRVTINNGTKDEPEWEFRFEGFGDESRFTSRFSVKTRKSTTTVAEFMVPVPTDYRDSGYSYGRELKYTARADDFPTQSAKVGGHYPNDWPSIAMSSGIGAKHSGLLEEERRTLATSSRYGGDNTFGSIFQPASLPADWRGYAGLDVLMITDKEWQDLYAKSPSICKAILDWNRLGGRLDIYSHQNLSAEALGIREVADGRRSLGPLKIYDWDGRSLDTAKTVTRYQSASKRRIYVTDREADYYALINSLGKRAFGNWQVAVILIAFGVLVGPVNLFVLAKPGRRHRLFFTTPLISLGASVLLVILILLQDGTGGRGGRNVVVNIEPSETSAYVSQFQASRTGVLFSGAFKAPDTYAAQCAMPANPWSAVTKAGDEAMRYSLEKDAFGGDWFQSRREHGHYLQTIRSTRGRVELTSKPSDEPAVVSSLGFDLTKLYFIDASGTLWRSRGGVTTGQPVALQKADDREWEPFIAANTRWISRDVLSRRGSFVALADKAPDLVIETHTWIEWNDRVLVHGPVVGTAKER